MADFIPPEIKKAQGGTWIPPEVLKTSAAPQEKPSFGGQAKAFGYGAAEEAYPQGTGLAAGELGAEAGAALGAFGGPAAPVTVPLGALIGGGLGYFGGEKAGEYLMSKIGQGPRMTAARQKRQEQYPNATLAGELAVDIPAAAMGAYGLYKAAPELYGALKKTPQVVSNLYQALTGGKQVALSAEELAAKSAALRKAGEKGLTVAEQRAAQAQKVAEKSKGASEQALSTLSGVKTIPEAGKYKPIPQTFTDVGNYARQQAEKFVTAIKTQRNAAADANFLEAKRAANIAERNGIFTDTTPLTKQIDKLIKKGGSSDYLRSLTQLKTDLERTKSFEGLEIIRRRLGDASFGVPEEGYAAIDQQFAGDMYKSLSIQMRDYFIKSGAGDRFGKFLDDYKRLSKNLEVYSTRLGKSLTGTQDASGRYVTKTADQITKDIFKSPESYEMFVDAVGGNRQVAEAAARKYFAGVLEQAKTEKQISDVIRNNRALLERMPSVRSEIENKYLLPVRTAEARAAGAEKIATASKVPSARSDISDAFSALSTAKPGKSIEAFETSVLPKIRQAEEKAGRKLFTDSQIDQIRSQVRQLDSLSDKAERNQLLAKIVGGLVGTAVLGTGAKNVLSRTLGAF
jgi:hypothetical protein